MNLQQQMARDLAVLKAAFPLLPEEFSDGRWESKITSGEESETVGSYSVSFGIDIGRVNFAGQRFEVFVPLVLVEYETIRASWCRYSINTPDGEDLYFPTVYSAIEFIGRISRALTLIDASAAALEARFGGAS